MKINPSITPINYPDFKNAATLTTRAGKPEAQLCTCSFTTF